MSDDPKNDSPDEQVSAPAPDEIEAPTARAAAFWEAMQRGAASVGRSVAGAYRFVDPDLRNHVYQLPVLGLTLLVPRAPIIEAMAPDGFRPLVLVHGLGGHPGNLFGLKTYFATRGRTRSYAVDFGNVSSVEVMVAHLRSTIDNIIACNELGPDAQVDIVAHSMGGLITRLALDDVSCRGRVGNVVTLGTPHGGSHLARFATSEFVRALRPGSEVLQQLESQDFWGRQDSPLLTALWSRADTIVLPAESARFEAGRNVEVEGVTHYGYLIQPSVWREVWRALLS